MKSQASMPWKEFIFLILHLYVYSTAPLTSLCCKLWVVCTYKRSGFKILPWHCCALNLSVMGLPPKKVSSFLWPVKDNLGLRPPGTYRNLCECGKVYTGQTGRSVDARLKEHQRHIHLEHPDKSSVAEYSVDLEHRIQFYITSILATKTRYMDHTVKEAIEIKFHSNNINREAGFCLSKSWKHLICSLNKSPEHDARSIRLRISIHARQLQPQGYWVNVRLVALAFFPHPRQLSSTCSGLLSTTCSPGLITNLWL
jgi:hypothetical protein